MWRVSTWGRFFNYVGVVFKLIGGIVFHLLWVSFINCLVTVCFNCLGFVKNRCWKGVCFKCLLFLCSVFVCGFVFIVLLLTSIFGGGPFSNCVSFLNWVGVDVAIAWVSF